MIKFTSIDVLCNSILIITSNLLKCAPSLINHSWFPTGRNLYHYSSKLDLFPLPLSQAAPKLPSADPQSPQSWVASNFFVRTIHPKNPCCHCPPLLSTTILFPHLKTTACFLSQKLHLFSFQTYPTPPSSITNSKWPVSSPASPSSTSKPSSSSPSPPFPLSLSSSTQCSLPSLSSPLPRVGADYDYNHDYNWLHFWCNHNQNHNHILK